MATKALEITSSGMLSKGSLLPGMPNCCECQLTPDDESWEKHLSKGTHHELDVLLLAPLQVRLGVVLEHERQHRLELQCLEEFEVALLGEAASVVSLVQTASQLNAVHQSWLLPSQRSLATEPTLNPMSRLVEILGKSDGRLTGTRRA